MQVRSHVSQPGGSGQSDTKGQAYWLRLSPLATQRTIDGGHVLYRDNPEGVVAQIGSVLRSIESDG